MPRLLMTGSALSRHASWRVWRPLPGLNWKWQASTVTSGFDPERTEALLGDTLAGLQWPSFGKSENETAAGAARRSNRFQKFTSTDVNQFTSTPHVWSDVQVGHHNAKQGVSVYASW